MKFLFDKDKLNYPKSINTVLAKALLSIDVSSKVTSRKLMEIRVLSCNVMKATITDKSSWEGCTTEE